MPPGGRSGFWGAPGGQPPSRGCRADRGYLLTDCGPAAIAERDGNTDPLSSLSPIKCVASWLWWSVTDKHRSSASEPAWPPGSNPDPECAPSLRSATRLADQWPGAYAIPGNAPEKGGELVAGAGCCWHADRRREQGVPVGGGDEQRGYRQQAGGQGAGDRLALPA